VRVVADTHAFYWYYRQPQLLSGLALATLHTALVGGDGVVVSVATFMDLWYLVRKGKMSGVALSHVWSLTQYPGINVTAAAITVRIAERSTSTPIDSLTDPWDRFIVGTAAVRGLPLITKDRRITALGVVQTVW
jgi:PIN domain nuclease of toxin-antitoxin system